MLDVLELKRQLLDIVYAHEQKHNDYNEDDKYRYDPGNTENLQYFYGKYDKDNSMITLCTEIKGLRYEERSRHLDEICEKDEVLIKRDPDNPFNSNNFEVFTVDGKSLGSLSADLCNRIASLYDLGYVVILRSEAYHIEKLEDRSRYVKQGVLFIKMQLKFVGV